MNSFGKMLLWLLVAATMQNLPLTTGLGVSSMLKVVRRPRQRNLFLLLLVPFSVVTTALFFPLDKAVPVTWVWLIFRPVCIVAITVILYVVASLLLVRFASDWYRHVKHLLPLAAFNNLVVGVAMVVNYQTSMDFFSAVGLALGSALGFVLLSAITAEGISRIDNPDTPPAFRGLPATLLYVGLLSLALMGFKPIFTLI
ncbi:MAG: hypothetical protein IJA68_01760 [Clostridia bacterium]|nr:hypothetical protein [Clostridia bacterium]